MEQKKKVLITGLGLLSSLGLGVEETVSALLEGRCGISMGDAQRELGDTYWPDYYGVVTGFQPQDFISDRRSIRKNTRIIHLSVSAAKLALEDADWTSGDEAGAYDDGVIIAVGIEENKSGFNAVYKASVNGYGEFDYELCGTQGVSKCPPTYILPRLPNTAAGQIAIAYQIKGINYSIVNNTNGGVVAVGEALNNIKSGRVKRIIAGGCNSPIGITYAYRNKYFDNFFDLTERGSAPFSRDRIGVIPAEGAGFLVLEEEASALARGAKIYGEVRGFSSTSKPRGANSTLELSRCFGRSMFRALESAGIEPHQVSSINASGIGLPAEDAAECMAIKKVFGQRVKDIPVSASKSQTGYMETASGSLELGIAALSIARDFVPPTIRWIGGDPDCDLDFVAGGARHYKNEHVLCNSFDIKGGVCSIIISKYDA